MERPIFNLQKQTSHGFTLVETLVAVTILAFAIIGPFALSAQSLRASHDARIELAATYLALEGIEAVHSIRSNNSADDATVGHTDWMDNIVSGTCHPRGCVLDVTEQQASDVWTDDALISCPGGGCAARMVVYYNPNTGLYRQSDNALTAPWQMTTFTRRIDVTGIDNPGNPQRQVLVTVTVTYLGYGHKTRTITLTDNFYNWFPTLN